MVKKITIYLLLCVCISAFAMKHEKKQKDIYKLSDLTTEVNRMRDECKNNKHVAWNDLMRRGNRIDHEPIEQTDTMMSKQQKK